MKSVAVEIVTDLAEARSLIETKHEPFVLSGFNIGGCTNKWTNIEYLQTAVKHDRQVRVHVSPVNDMNFIKKNFVYRSLSFKEFIKRASNSINTDFFISPDEKYYLRSVGEDERKDVSDIKKQYPDLINDINFPPLFDQERFFSSVFRISSSNIRLWTHYDVMDNMLIQVVGLKRVVLFPPADFDFLYMNGDKSEVINVDEPDLEAYPLFAKATKYECELKPGDILFIPALWLHNVIAESYSVSVNVFWRELDKEFYNKNDIYGNNDLVPAAKCVDMIKRIQKELGTMPDTYRDFYTKRIIKMLSDGLTCKNSH